MQTDHSVEKKDTICKRFHAAPKSHEIAFTKPTLVSTLLLLTRVTTRGDARFVGCSQIPIDNDAVSIRSLSLSLSPSPSLSLSLSLFPSQTDAQNCMQIREWACRERRRLLRERERERERGLWPLGSVDCHKAGFPFSPKIGHLRSKRSAAGMRDDLIVLRSSAHAVKCRLSLVQIRFTSHALHPSIYPSVPSTDKLNGRSCRR